MRIIRHAKVLIDGTLVEKEVLFDRNILAVEDHIETDAPEIDGAGLTLIPGLVDVHAHFRQPGHEEKETIRSGSMAAAHGGYTSVFVMPNVIPFPNDAETMKSYLELIERESIIHTYPFGTITENEAGRSLSDLDGMASLGIRWFSDDGIGMNDASIMTQALKLSDEKGYIISCHTEDLAYRPKGASVHESDYAKAHGWIGIPDACESAPLANDLELAQAGGHYHACHISSHQSVEYLRRAKENGVDCTAEVTAHHLLLNNEDVKGPDWKMNPPLRTEMDRQCLIQALEDGTLDFIANDHAPHTEADKHKPMSQAAFGIVAIETAFPLLYTEFVHRQKRWTLGQLVAWMSEKPAKRFGLDKVGRIEVGWHSDMVLVDLNTVSQIDSNRFFSKGKNTPFDGYEVACEIARTIVDGQTVYQR